MKKIITLGIFQILIIPFYAIASVNENPYTVHANNKTYHFNPAVTPEILKQQLQEKERQLLAAEKELRYYGSEAPAITNTRLGLLATAGGVTVALLAILFCENKDTKKNLTGAGVIAGFCGLGVASFSGMANDLAHTEAQNICKAISKEKQELLVVVESK